MRTIGAGEFKTRCLAILDEVAETGDEVVVTKRGRPVARLVPVEEPVSLLNSVRYADEAAVVEPEGTWKATT